MKTIILSLLGIISLILILISLSYAFGWIGVHQKKTIGKAMQNINREIFEESQSYVEGKRQEAIRLYKESKLSKSESDKAVLCSVASQSFANFDIYKLKEPSRSFILNCIE